MSQQTGRIEELRFETAQLIGIGSYFDSYSTRSINGTIESISLGSNNFVNIGSLLIYFSGTNNVADQDLILRIRAGSMMQTVYPFIQQIDNQGVVWNAGSVQTTNFIGNSTIRIVGSGIGDTKSGTFVVIKYR